MVAVMLPTAAVIAAGMALAMVMVMVIALGGRVVGQAVFRNLDKQLNVF